jgi:hypothetical protein
MDKHEAAKKAAIKAGCEPFWHDGILGFAWHCGCEEPNTHYIDQQCSVVRFYRTKGASA